MTHWLRARYDTQRDPTLAQLGGELRGSPSEHLAEALLAVVLEIAQADGRTSRLETDRMLALLVEHPSLRTMERHDLDAMVEGWTTLVTEDRQAARRKAREAILSFCEEPGAGRMLLLCGLNVAMADRELAPAEIAAARDLAECLGMSVTEVDSLLRAAVIV